MSSTMPGGAAPAIETIELPVGPLRFTADVCGPAGGTPVLLLHGFPQSRHAWRLQLPVLGAAGFRAIAPDQRGYSPGARPAGSAAYEIDRLLEDVLGFIEASGHQRAHLAGIDWGGDVAWHFAARHPERVISLSVLSRPHPLAFVQALTQDPVQAQRSAHHRAFLEPGAPARLRENDLAPLRTMLKAHGVPAEGIAGYLGVLSPPGALEAAMEWYVANVARLTMTSLPPITMPCLYVWGTDDHTVGRFAAEGTARYVPAGYRFVALEGGGHFLTDQMPAEIDALLLEHLGRAGAGRGQ